MSKETRKISVWRVIGFILLAPFLAPYGAFVLVRGVVRFVGRVRGMRRALDATLRCPNGHETPTTGRYNCARCGGTYTGWVGRCGICGAGAGWVRCTVCEVSIRLPWSA